MKRIEHWKVIAVCLYLFDAFTAFFSYAFALWLRFDGAFSQVPGELWNAYFHFIPIYAVATLLVFTAFRLYRCMWRFIGFNELMHIVTAWCVLMILHFVAMSLAFGRMPISYYIIGGVIQLLCSFGIRYSYRFYLKWMQVRDTGRPSPARKNAMIIGAGEAGQIIIRDIRNNMKNELNAACVIDDDKNLLHRFIDGVPVVGSRDDILTNVEKYHIDQILFAIPSAEPEEKREILNLCNDTGCEVKLLPGFYQFLSGEVSLAKMKDVAIEDLLGREPIHVNTDEIYAYLNGKTILVTGGGGSIGSELCRQIARHEPKQLIIFDIYENNAYSIEQELRAEHPQLNLVVLIGSVRDSRRINDVFAQYRPEIVYHAAAHKHVPLMETSPNEAIKNNVIGTYKTAYAALMHGAERFVLISTDKAVNPTNIMGASKRLCEMVIQSMDAICKSGRLDMLPLLHAHKELQPHELFEQDIGLDIQQLPFEGEACTEFVAVRFGNVLGSNGSVIPLFKKQIERGGPVTVTHPDIIRYFMTIPEAVGLVMEAGVHAKGGEIFVLDMGTPMKIDTLARNLIKLSGYKPDEDIKIVYTGLRPGEKLYEEKLMAEEGLTKTENNLIHIAHPIEFDLEDFLHRLEVLATASYENSQDIVDLVAQTVSTFHPVGEFGQKITPSMSEKIREMATMSAG